MKYNHYSSYCFFILFSFILSSTANLLREEDKKLIEKRDETEHENYLLNIAGRGMRRLIGSNCLSIERGDYPPFYECVGCVVEEAQACVDDMRYNKSLNVHPSCAMYATSQSYDSTNCCPQIVSIKGRLDLSYIGAAYPMALSCIEKVGCKASTIYKQLLKECYTICPGIDSRSKGSVCLSQFNSVSRTFALPSFVMVLLIFSILVSV